MPINGFNLPSRRHRISTYRGSTAALYVIYITPPVETSAPDGEMLELALRRASVAANAALFQSVCNPFSASTALQACQHGPGERKILMIPRRRQRSAGKRGSRGAIHV
jgi:hypothetical protein